MLSIAVACDPPHGCTDTNLSRAQLTSRYTSHNGIVPKDLDEIGVAKYTSPPGIIISKGELSRRPIRNQLSVNRTRSPEVQLTDPIQAKKATKTRFRVSSSRIAFLLPKAFLVVSIVMLLSAGCRMIKNNGCARLRSTETNLGKWMLQVYISNVSRRTRSDMREVVSRGSLLRLIASALTPVNSSLDEP
jgi:hypothetical protein